MANILITGGSKGIGFELVKKALHEGHNVVTIARTIEGLKNVKNPSLTIIQQDILDMSEASFAEIGSKYRIEYLINNSAMLINQSWDSISEQDFSRTMALNVWVPYTLTRALVKADVKLKHIVNIGSMGGFQGAEKYPDILAYSCSKGAIHTLTEGLSAALTPKQISVNALALGAVQTDMLAEAFPGYKAPISPSQIATYILDFTLEGYRFYNGKILPVNTSNP